MVVDATREFRAAVAELDRAGPPPDLRQKVSDWYAEHFIPEMRRVLGREPALADYLPVGAAPYYLQYHYIVANPHPAARRKLLDDAGDGSDYSRLHAVYHPLMRAAATTVGFFDFMMADPKSGRLIYTVEKEVDFTTSLQAGPYRRSNVAAAVARCAATADRSAVCLEDFAPYAPSGGAPIAFMAAPVIDQGVVIGVLIAQLSNEEIDNVVTGGSPLAPGRLRRHGRGLPRRARLSGALRPAGVLRESRPLLRRAEGRRRLGRGDRRHPALRDAGAASADRHPGDAGRDRRRRGHGRDHRLPWRPDARVMGTAGDSRRQLGARRQDRHRRGLRADLPAAPGPDDRRRTGAAGRGRHRRLACRARCSGRCASSPPG